MKKLLIIVGLAGLVVPSANAYDPKGECEGSQISNYAFSWPVLEGCANKPRGGSSKGAEVEITPAPTAQWQALQKQGLSKFERDRQAILAMQGGYKVNFDFLETIGFSDDYERDRPYQSWGTEYVYVVKDEPKLISLQHLMVMYFQQEDGTVSEPMVMKHWRQDWRYEDDTLLEYRAGDNWQNVELDQQQQKGHWTQAVFQVDDSPRYESYGEWQHNASFSSWKSATTRRPLPRREHSVRDDYGVLEGTNTHVITQHGWVQVEENWKLAVNEQGQADQSMPYLAKEQGLARYQPAQNVDFEPGDEYMALAGLFWQDVVAYWQQVLNADKQVKVAKILDKQPLFVPLFDYAQQVMQAGEYDQQAGKAYAKKVIDQYMQ